MSPLFIQVEKQARLLTVAERATLAHILIAGLNSEETNHVEAIWIAEAQRRFEAYRRGEIEVRAGDIVMMRARHRLHNFSG